MARILLAAMPFAGHVQPVAGLAAELLGRGHDVVFYTGAKYGRTLARSGIRWLPWIHAKDFDDSALRESFPEANDGVGLRAVAANFRAVFFGTAAGQYRDLRLAHAAAPFDAVVGDVSMLGPALLYESTLPESTLPESMQPGSMQPGTGHLPWASISVTPLTLRSSTIPPLGFGLSPGQGRLGRLRDAAARTAADLTGGRLGRRMGNRVRHGVGLPPNPALGLDSFYSPRLVLCQGVPELEFPRGDLPASVKYVGDLAAAGNGAELPPWWADLDDGRPIVHITQGTLGVNPQEVIFPAIEALAGLDLWGVVSLDPAALAGRRVPANIRLARRLPYAALLPRCAAMVTNGGYGAVVSALGAGVPLVVAGAALDKPEIALRIAASGAGINLRTGAPAASQIRAAVQTVLAEPSYRAAAGRIAAAVQAAGGTGRAAALIEDLAAGRR